MEKVISKAIQRQEIGKTAVLICVMTMKGATEDELRRAILYSAEVLSNLNETGRYGDLKKKYEIKELVDKYNPEKAE